MSFQYGFYAELNELRKEDSHASFGFLENIEVTSELNAHKFLHGFCDEFAAMLSDVFGYEIECVRNANHRLIHAYCVSYIGDEKAYIDVRGITTDKVLFFEEFENELTYYAPEDVFLVIDDDGYELEAKDEIWPGKKELFDGDLEDWDDTDIKKFIIDFKEYYDVGRLLNKQLDNRIAEAAKLKNAKSLNTGGLYEQRLDSEREL